MTYACFETYHMHDFTHVLKLVFMHFSPQIADVAFLYLYNTRLCMYMLYYALLCSVYLHFIYIYSELFNKAVNVNNY